MNKPFQVTILWGSDPTREGSGDPEPHVYKFTSQAELDAFVVGVDESNGWMDYATYHNYQEALDALQSLKEEAGWQWSGKANYEPSGYRQVYQVCQQPVRPSTATTICKVEKSADISSADPKANQNNEG